VSPLSLDELAVHALGDHPHPGALYGISLGPGDPGLLTVRAAALLQRLDVVVAPRSERMPGVSRGVVAPLVEPERLLELPSAMPRSQADVLDGWRSRIAPLLAALHEGAPVGFTTVGDASLYSTFAYASAAVLEMRPQTPVFVVPGVTAMSAAAAVEGRPLALGPERLVVLPTARIDDASLRMACESADTVVLLKAGGALDRVRALSQTAARGWSVRFARRVGLDGEEHRDGLDTDSDDYVSLVVLRRPGTFTSQLATTPAREGVR
jgi:precorrin-2/cobalt-factor-2 C20-methyltransferase